VVEALKVDWINKPQERFFEISWPCACHTPPLEKQRNAGKCHYPFSVWSIHKNNVELSVLAPIQ